jgi:outer membrane protein OmpA-like peptidoglycan-associated protein
MKRRIVVLAACCVSLASWAGDVRYFNEDQVPTSDEIAALLAAPASVSPSAATPSGAGHGGRTRLVRLIDSQETPHRVEAVPRPEPQQRMQVARLSSVGSVALALRFDADANRIQGHHLAQLDALAAGIKRLPDNALVTITGHTDAYGPALYNIDLSLRRAMAVRAYLVQVHGIPARRLVAMGKGKSEPLNRANPFAPENRRVQVHAEYDVA